MNETERSAYLNHQEVEFKSQDDKKFLNEIDQTSGDNETGGPLGDDEENLLLDIRQKHNNARPDTEPMILNQVRTHQTLTYSLHMIFHSYFVIYHHKNIPKPVKFVKSPSIHKKTRKIW